MPAWIAQPHAISLAEILHRQRSRNPRTLNVLSVLTLVAVLVLFTVHRATKQNGQIVLLAMIAIHTLHFLTSSLALTFAYDSIQREQRTHSWELLRITPLTVGTLVRGKFGAVIRWLAPLYVRVIGLKLTFLLWQLTQIHSKAHTVMRGTYSYFEDGQFLGLSVAAMLFVVVYLLADMLATTALGITIALVMPSHHRRLGLGFGLLLRWWMPLLTLFAVLTYTVDSFDPLPTNWNSHWSLAARYTTRYGFDYVGAWGAVNEVFPSMAITVPDGPLLVFMHTISASKIHTVGVFISILAHSLLAYLVLALGTIAVGWSAARRHTL